MTPHLDTTPAGVRRCTRATAASLLMRLTIAAACVAACSGTARAQSGALSEGDSALFLRLDEPLRAAVTPVLDTARSDRLPIEPLIDKALEGQSKAATPERIVAVVDGLERLMREARSALGAAASPAELVAGASALHAGAPSDALRRLRAARPHGPVTVPLGVMSELIARGVPPDTSATVVVGLARAGASDANLVTLRKNVDVDLAAGIAPSISAVRRAIQANPGPGPGPGGPPPPGSGPVGVPTFVP